MIRPIDHPFRRQYNHHFRFRLKDLPPQIRDALRRDVDDMYLKTEDLVETVVDGYITARPKESYNTMPKECWAWGDRHYYYPPPNPEPRFYPVTWEQLYRYLRG